MYSSTLKEKNLRDLKYSMLSLILRLKLSNSKFKLSLKPNSKNISNSKIISKEDIISKTH